MNDLADFIRSKRKQMGLTQVELAKNAGVGLRFVRELESGKQTLRCDTVNKVFFIWKNLWAS